LKSSLFDGRSTHSMTAVRHIMRQPTYNVYHGRRTGSKSIKKSELYGLFNQINRCKNSELPAYLHCLAPKFIRQQRY